MQQPALPTHILRIAVDHGVDALTLRLFSRLPNRLVKGLFLLLDGLAGKQIIIVRHTLSLLLLPDFFVFLFGRSFVSGRLLPPDILLGSILHPLLLFRPDLLQRLTNGRAGTLHRIRDTRIVGLFGL